ncbi:hypothetical protein ACQFYA_11615 [Promicromonospora sp. Marseille-Q5078]
MTGTPAAAAGVAPGSGGAAVPTYRGDVPGAALGWTLTHEHVFVRAPELDAEYPHPEWDADAAVAAAVPALDDLYALGVRTLVDLTVPGLGRDVRLVGRVASRTRLYVVAATGWYTHDALPLALRAAGPGRLVDGPDPLVVTLGMDRFGMTHTGDDEARFGFLAELLRRGYASQLVMSQDSACFSRVTPPSWRRAHAPSWTVDHLARHVVPRLADAGVDPRDVETMTVHNARRILAGEGSGGA